MTRIVVDSKVQSTSTELVKSKGALNSTLISNKYWPPSSRITIIRTYTKTFASVPKETSLVLDPETSYARLSRKSGEKKKEKKNKQNGNYEAFLRFAQAQQEVF